MHEGLQARPWTEKDEVVDQGEDYPREQDRHIEFQVGDDEGPPGDPCLKSEVIGRKREIPDRPLVGDEHQDCKDSLEYGKGSNDGNHLEPGLDVEQVDIESKKENGEHRHAEHQPDGSTRSMILSPRENAVLKYFPVVAR